MQNTVYVSISGTNFATQFIVREMSLFFPNNSSWRHYFFDTPRGLRLSDGDKKTDWFTRRVLGGIGIYSRLPGSLEYGQHRAILVKLGTNHKICCAGHISAQFLQNLLPYADIEDLQQTHPFNYPRSLPTANCGTDHKPRFCSLAKLRYLISG